MPLKKPIYLASPAERDEIYQLIKPKVLVHAADLREALGRLCFFWTWEGLRELQRRGYEAQMQAGTAGWQFCEDTGDNLTHWGHEWSPEEIYSRQRLDLGGLPEIHIWIAGVDRITHRDQIVDFSVGQIPSLVEAELGPGKWTRPQPPDYFWGGLEDFPDGWVYRANVPAIELVYQKFKLMVQEIRSAKKQVAGN